MEPLPDPPHPPKPHPPSTPYDRPHFSSPKPPFLPPLRLRTNLHNVHVERLFMFRVHISEQPRKADNDIDLRLQVHGAIGTVPWSTSNGVRNSDSIPFRRAVFQHLVTQYDDLVLPPRMVFHGNRFAFADQSGPTEAIGTHPVLVKLEENNKIDAHDDQQHDNAVIFDVTFDEPVIVTLHDFDDDYELSEEDEQVVRKQLHIPDTADIANLSKSYAALREWLEATKRNVKRELCDALADMVRNALRADGLRALELDRSSENLPAKAFAKNDTLAELVFAPRIHPMLDLTFTSMGSLQQHCRAQPSHHSNAEPQRHGSVHLNDFGSSSSTLHSASNIPRTKARVVEGDCKILLSLPYSLSNKKQSRRRMLPQPQPQPQQQNRHRASHSRQSNLGETRSISSSSSFNSMAAAAGNNKSHWLHSFLHQSSSTSTSPSQVNTGSPANMNEQPNASKETSSSTLNLGPHHRRNQTCLDISSLAMLENLQPDLPIQATPSSMLSSIMSPNRKSQLRKSVSQQHGMLRLPASTPSNESCKNGDKIVCGGIVLKGLKVSAEQFSLKVRHDSRRFGIGLASNSNGVREGWVCIAESGRVEYESGAKLFCSKLVKEMAISGCKDMINPFMIHAVPTASFTDLLSTMCSSFPDVRKNHELQTLFDKPVVALVLDDDFCDESRYADTDAENLTRTFYNADIKLGVPMMRFGSTLSVTNEDKPNIYGDHSNMPIPILPHTASRVHSIIHGCNYTIGHGVEDFMLDKYEHHVVIGITYSKRATHNYFHSYAKPYHKESTKQSFSRNDPLGFMLNGRGEECVVAAVAHDLWLSTILQNKADTSSLIDRGDDLPTDDQIPFKSNNSGMDEENLTDKMRHLRNLRFARSNAVRKDGNVCLLIQDVWKHVQALRASVEKYLDIDLGTADMRDRSEVPKKNRRKDASKSGPSEDDSTDDEQTGASSIEKDNDAWTRGGRSVPNPEKQVQGETKSHEKIAIFRENGDDQSCCYEVQALYNAYASNCSSSSPYAGVGPQTHNIFFRTGSHESDGSSKDQNEGATMSSTNDYVCSPIRLPPSVSYIGFQRPDVHGVRLMPDVTGGKIKSNSDFEVQLQLDAGSYMDGAVIERDIVRHDRFQFFLVPFHKHSDRPARPTLYHVIRFLDQQGPELSKISGRKVQRWVYRLSLGPVFSVPVQAVACTTEAGALANRVMLYAGLLPRHHGCAPADDQNKKTNNGGGVVGDDAELSNDDGNVCIHPDLIHKPFYI